jgi:hypothetical protein
VKLHARMLLQEVSNELGSVGGEVVEDDMNLLPGRAQRHHFFEEGNEVTAGVAGRGSSVHAASLGVQRGIERKRSMPIVLEAVTLGSSRRKRQHRIEPIQGLNGGFLIDAEHGGMLRRPQIQADNVGRFAFELRIVAGLPKFRFRNEASRSTSDVSLWEGSGSRLCTIERFRNS